MNWGSGAVAPAYAVVSNQRMNPELSLMEPWKLSSTGAPRGGHGTWREDDLTRLIPLLPGTTRLIVEMSLLTGLPIGDIVALRLDDVDAVRGRVRLAERGRRRWLQVPASLRGRLSDQHRQVLWVYRGDRLAGWGAPSGRGHPAGWLFPAQNPRVQPGGGRKLRVPVSEACVRETVWRVSLIAGGAPVFRGTRAPEAARVSQDGASAPLSNRATRGAPRGRRRHGAADTVERRRAGSTAAPTRGLASMAAGFGVLPAPGSA